MRKTYLTLFILFISPFLSANSKGLIPHSVGVTFSERGYKQISNNIQEILFLNGISPDSFYLEKVNHQTEKAPLETLFKDRPEFADIVKSWRHYLERILVGIRFDAHEFSLEAQKLEVSVNWDEIDISFESPESGDGIILKLKARAKGLNLNVDKVRAKDLSNIELGEIGFDDLLVELDQDTGPLEIEVSILLKGVKGEVKAQVLPLEWNWPTLGFNASYARPLVFPEIEILINGHSVKVNTEELDNLFREKMPNLLKNAGAMIGEYVEGPGVKNINELIEVKLKEGLEQTNQMTPPGSKGNVRPFNWGIKINQMSLENRNLTVDLSGFAIDGLKKEAINLKKLRSSTKKFSVKKSLIKKYDMALGINQGLLNRVMNLSSKRGYFSEFEVEGQDPIRLTKSPILDLKTGTPRMTLEVEYTVKGFSSVTVKNPIKIQLDLLLDFPVKNGKVEVVAKGIDLDSLHLDDKYIRFFRKKVRKALRNQVDKLQKDLVGFTLADELPFPSSLFGVGVKIKNVDIDKNGHFVVYHDFDWSLFEE